MAKYKDLVGTSVVDVAGDPDNPLAGQLWYNTTENEYRYRRQFKGNAWSSGGNLNTGREGMGGCGTQSAGFAFDGATAPAYQALAEQYNGSTWTEVADLNMARSELAAFGTQTAAYGAQMAALGQIGAGIASSDNRLKKKIK